MWGNPMLFHLAKSVEKILKKDKYRQNQSRNVFFHREKYIEEKA